MSKEYKIGTVGDFLQVPAERRAACLVEFLDWIALSEAAIAPLKSIQGSEGFRAAMIEGMGFVWIDDGKRDIALEFRVKRKEEPRAEGGAGEA